MVEVVLGGARSGKAKEGLARFCEQIDSLGQAKAMWVVPHRNLARTLRLRTAREVGAVSELKILTLDDFARMVFQSAQSKKEVISDFGRLLLISELMEQSEEEDLKQWKSKKEIVSSLAQAIDELKENLLWPRKAPAHFAKEYESILAKHQFVDRKSMFASAVRTLQQENSFCQQQGIETVLFYGFTTFSPLEWRLASVLTQQCKTWFSLTAIPNQPQVFAQSLSTLALIRKSFEIDSEKVLEEKSELPQPRVLHFSNHDNELEWIARECLRLHQEEGVPLNEMALISGAGGSLSWWVEQVFNRYGLPVQSLAPEPMLRQPLIRHLFSTLKKDLSLDEEAVDLFLKSVLELPPEEAQKHLAAWSQWQHSFEELKLYPKLKQHGLETLCQIDFRPPPLKTSAIHFYGVESPPLESYRVVFISHLLEGSIPRRPSINLFCGEPVEGELKHAQRERLHFYHLVTRAQEKIYLSYSQKSAQGQEELPSLYLRDWKTFFPAQVLPDVEKVGGVTPKMDQGELERVQEPIKEFIQRKKEGLLKDPGLVEKLKQRLQTGTSVTQLEAFGKCPFLHFSSHLLRLQDEKIETWNMVRGQIAHDVLSVLGPDLLEGKLDWLRQKMEEEIEKTFKNLEFPFTESEMALEKKRLVQVLEIFLEKEKERLNKRGDRPVHFEKPFGAEGESLYQLELDKGLKVSLRGRIDRIDLSEDGEEAIVIDYKSGSLPAPKGMNEGVNLQIACYLDVCQQVLGLKPKEGHYLSLKENKLNGIKAKEIETRLEQMRSHIQKHAHQMMEGQIQPDPTDPTICSHCSYRTICRVNEEVL